MALSRRDKSYAIESWAAGYGSAVARSLFVDDNGQKLWFDWADFATAFFIACSIHQVCLSKTEVDLLLKHFAEGQADRCQRA